MQTPLDFSHPRPSVGLRVLLFTTLLILGLPSVSLAACAHYHSKMSQAVRNFDLDTLEKLLPTLNRQPDCPVSYLDAVKRSMAQIAAANADRLVQQKQLGAAQAWLRRAPTMVWNTQAIHGDIAARRQQWHSAAQFFNQALDLMNDPQATPNSPTRAEIEKVYQLAQEAQLLAGSLGDTISRAGEARGMMRASVRGYGPKRRLIPILFKRSQGRLTSKGKKSARRLAKYLIRKKQRVAEVILIGHSDSKGSQKACKRVSKRRAKAVRQYLRMAGVDIKIRAIGKGKKQPLKLVNRWKLTHAQVDKLNRRVEFQIKYK
jgi:outer membrane protein OmpA-like peptidoglycan-associated protein